MKTPKTKALRHIFQNNVFMLRYVFKYVPKYAIAHILLQMAFGINDIIWGMLLMKITVDAVVVYRSFWLAALMPLIYLLYCGGIQIIAAFFHESYQPAQKQKLGEKMQGELFVKAARIDYSCYSNPAFYNDFVWAASEAESRASQALDLVAELCKYLTTLVGLISAMLVMDATGLLFVLVAFIGSFFIHLLINKINFKKDLELKPLDRKRSYINRVFYLADYAKEMRLHNLKDHLEKDFDEANDQMKGVVGKYAKPLMGLSFLGDFGFQTLILDCGFLLLLAYKTIVKKSVTYGTFAGMLDGVWTLKWTLSNLSGTLSQFQQQSMYIDKFRGFLEYEVKMVDRPDAVDPPAHTAALEVKDISFTYDGASEPTLRHLSLSVRPGEKIAIVGYNGAGKSTLIKLITRLYDVTEGEILYDGVDIRDYRLSSYRDCFGTVFQDYQMFAATLGENVMMDLAEGREADIRNALDQADFTAKLNQLPQGLETELTKEFYDDGTVFSGGEAQKVAISRVFAKDSRVMILDEPSSALDPLSEYRLNQAMLEAAKDKTVIFISHRLSTTKLADRIYMMEQGEIIESGSHDELMAQNGKYAEMFRLQSANYIL